MLPAVAAATAQSCYQGLRQCALRAPTPYIEAFYWCSCNLSYDRCNVRATCGHSCSTPGAIHPARTPTLLALLLPLVRSHCTRGHVASQFSGCPRQGVVLVFSVRRFLVFSSPLVLLLRKPNQNKMKMPGGIDLGQGPGYPRWGPPRGPPRRTGRRPRVPLSQPAATAIAFVFTLIAARAISRNRFPVIGCTSATRTETLP